MHFRMLFVICLSLDQSKILLSGNGLSNIYFVLCIGFPFLFFQFLEETLSHYVKFNLLSASTFNIDKSEMLYSAERLTLTPTSPGFYVSAVQAF